MWPWSRIAHISAFSFLKENPASCRTRQLFCRCLVSCSYNTVLEEREHISCAVYTIRITCFNLSRKRILSIRQKSVKWVSWDIFGNKANLPFKKKKKASVDLGMRDETELVELLVQRLKCTDTIVLSKQEGKAKLCCQ